MYSLSNCWFNRYSDFKIQADWYRTYHSLRVHVLYGWFSTDIYTKIVWFSYTFITGTNERNWQRLTDIDINETRRRIKFQSTKSYLKCLEWWLKGTVMHFSHLSVVWMANLYPLFRQQRTIIPINWQRLTVMDNRQILQTTTVIGIIFSVCDIWYKMILQQVSVNLN